MNNFFKRLAAFVIDLLFISLLCNAFSLFTIDSRTVQALNKELTTTYETYQKQEIDDETFVNQSSDIAYDMLRASGLYYIISIGLYILYFGWYQYRKHGQTIGKKIMHIKVKGKDKDLTVNDYFFRSLLINGILFDFIVVLLLFFGSKDVFMNLYTIIKILEFIVIGICGTMVIMRKDNRGLHDLIGHSEVVNE